VKIEREEGVLSAALVTGTDPDTTSTPLPRIAMPRGRLELEVPGHLLGLAAGVDVELVADVLDKRRLTGHWSTTSGPDAGAPRLLRGKKVKSKPDEAKKDLLPPLAATADPFPPLPEPAPPAVVVRNATIWTCGPSGTLTDSDLLVRKGKIEAVGQALAAPAGATVIDGTGQHVTPGIIDSHSHSAQSGGTNEGTRSATAEVRIGDVINPESIQIYRHLAGGVTASNQLHGSANAIGGQSAVIKHRWGATADALRVTDAVPGIKFALGENVKQSNWGDKHTTRYPQTRMGVEQWIRDRFLTARDYMQEWEEWRSKKRGAAPRRDLQLEALAEILRGERVIHCHAYRQDEMLMLIRLADEFGFRLATFEHVLEGYKIANEMAEHGVGGSSFSDWWAYKFEVYDAIPYNGTIMWDRGVLVSFNSDSSELARRLNTEAAKAVKYGGVPEVEALKFVTLNPARMLGIDDRVGSLEPGKDGDFAIWNAPPLSNLARCEQTWIEGRRYFDRERDLASREAAETQRLALLERARKARVELEGRGVDTGWKPTFGRRFGESEGELGLELGLELELEQGVGRLTSRQIEALRQIREED
jgi:N-acetylglucosamine-6-phosphate deacetylase